MNILYNVPATKIMAIASITSEYGNVKPNRFNGSSQLSNTLSEIVKTAMVSVTGNMSKSPVKKSEDIESMNERNIFFF